MSIEQLAQFVLDTDNMRRERKIDVRHATRLSCPIGSSVSELELVVVLLEQCPISARDWAMNTVGIGALRY